MNNFIFNIQIYYIFVYIIIIISKIYITENIQTLKYVSLVTLTLQNAMVGLSMRYSRTRAGDMFLSSTGTYVLLTALYEITISFIMSVYIKHKIFLLQIFFFSCCNGRSS